MLDRIMQVLASTPPELAWTLMEFTLHKIFSCDLKRRRREAEKGSPECVCVVRQSIFIVLIHGVGALRTCHLAGYHRTYCKVIKLHFNSELKNRIHKVFTPASLI
jgi:hypothetical protein